VPSFSICEYTTLGASFEEDLAAYASAGADGIGLCEIKLRDGDEQQQLARLRDAGLVATFCNPGVPSILPLSALPGPHDVDTRVASIRSAILRFAPFAPKAVTCLTGPAGERPASEAYELVVESLRDLADVAAEVDVQIAVEPFHPDFAPLFSLVATLREAVDLAATVDRKNVGVLLDIWHVWSDPTLLDTITRCTADILGVHASNWRAETRGWADRALPADGVANVPEILGALDRAGYGGFYEVEIFSDNGAFGTRYPDSLWDLSPLEMARRSKASFDAAWDRRTLDPVLRDTGAAHDR
jgi:sugar phosphate isomerase/epimerase